MSRSRVVMLSSLLAAALGVAVVAAARTAVAPTKVFEISSIAAVQNGASVPSVFTTAKAWRVTEIWTYHWNDARGVAPGTIGLKSLTTGKLYGPWKAIGSPGQGGVPNAYWHVSLTAKVVLPAGRYRFVDSSPGTWSQNAETGHRGMGWVMAIPATASGC